MQILTYSKTGGRFHQMKEEETKQMRKKMSLDMRDFIPQNASSLFMDAFAYDCILILKNMKYKHQYQQVV